jgi:hypothetical protein
MGRRCDSVEEREEIRDKLKDLGFVPKQKKPFKVFFSIDTGIELTIRYETRSLDTLLVLTTATIQQNFFRSAINTLTSRKDFYPSPKDYDHTLEWSILWSRLLFSKCQRLDSNP